MAFRRTRRTLRRRPRRTRRAMARGRMLRPRGMRLNTRVPNTYKFSRSSFFQAPLTSFLMNANGQFFGTIIAQGLTSIYTDNAVLAMPNVSEFTTLFDQYKILRFSVTFIPRFNSQEAVTVNSTGTVLGQFMPTIYWVTDQDDATAPTSANQIMEHAKVRSRQLNRPVTLTVKYPCIADSIYSSSVVTGYATRKAPWIDLASTSVQHYGIKYFIQGYPNQQYRDMFDIKASWTFLVKNPR